MPRTASSLHVGEHTCERITRRRGNDDARRAERERLASAVELARGDERVHDDAGAERRKVVAERERRAAVAGELDEGDVDRESRCAGDGRVDRRDVLEQVALLAHDMLDRMREVDVLARR